MVASELDREALGFAEETLNAHRSGVAAMSLRVLVGLLLLGASSGLVLAEEAWSTAESAAVSEWKNGEGKGYGKALEKAFPKDHGATLSACASELPKPSRP